MKFSVFAFVLLIASAFAIPEVKHEERPPNIVEQRVINAVNRLTNLIRRLGLDPIIIEKAEAKRTLLPGIFELRAYVENMKMSGGSHILLKYVDYNILLGRLRTEFVIPELRMSIGKSGIEFQFGDSIDIVELSGSLSIRDITLSAEISFNASLDEGITVRSITINFRIDEVKSHLKLVVFERNYSDFLNTLFGESIPALLDLYENEINRGMELIIRRILETVL